MPNHIITKVWFQGPEEDVDLLLDQIKSRNDDNNLFDFERIVPLVHHATSRWYYANWGTRWNSYDVQYNADTKTFLFLTETSAALPVFQQLSLQFPFVHIYVEYAEEGGPQGGRLVYLEGKVEAREDLTGTPKAARLHTRLYREQGGVLVHLYRDSQGWTRRCILTDYDDDGEPLRPLQDNDGVMVPEEFDLDM